MTDQVRLSSVKLGEKVVRFLYHREGNLFYVTDVKSAADLPLFLGADVLAASTQATKNHARIHARYAKDGLATRASFKDLKVCGTPNSGSMWFYTIQGLFQVAFEYLTVHFQRDCLVLLRDLWLARYDDEPVRDTMEMTLLTDTDCNTVQASHTRLTDTGGSTTQASHTRLTDTGGSTTQASHTRLTDTGGGTTQTSHSRLKAIADESVSDTMEVVLLTDTDGSTIKASHTRICPDPGPCVVDYAVILAQPEQDTMDIAEQDDVTTFVTQSNLLEHEQVDVHTNYSRDSIDKHVGQNILIPPQSVEHEETNNGVLSDLVSYIRDFVKNKEKGLQQTEKILLHKLYTLLEFFELEYMCNTQPAFPCHIFEQYNKLIKGSDFHKHFHNDFGIPMQTNIVLCLMCEWVGKELSAMADCIMQKVNTFKVEHIDHINNLPQPKSLVTQLFPQCMTILLMNWMGQQGSWCGTGADVSDQDHNYSPPHKKIHSDRNYMRASKRSPTNMYPFIQLILEFTNNALVSGVAHVLYTRLLHDM